MSVAAGRYGVTMIRLQVYKTVSVREIDPGDLIEVHNGGGVLRVANVTRDGSDFVIAGRPPSRDQGRHVIAKFPSDAQVRVLPSPVAEAAIMAAMDPNTEGSWKCESPFPTHRTWLTQVGVWTVAITGQASAPAPAAAD